MRLTSRVSGPRYDQTKLRASLLALNEFESTKTYYHASVKRSMASYVLNMAKASAEVVQGVLFWELRAVTGAGVQQSFWWFTAERLEIIRMLVSKLLKQNTSNANCASIDCSTWKDYLKASEIVFWQTVKCVDKKAQSCNRRCRLKDVLGWRKPNSWKRSKCFLSKAFEAKRQAMKIACP